VQVIASARDQVQHLWQPQLPDGFSDLGPAGVEGEGPYLKVLQATEAWKGGCRRCTWQDSN
jgi:hypothetical protein